MNKMDVVSDDFFGTTEGEGDKIHFFPVLCYPRNRIDWGLLNVKKSMQIKLYE